MAVMLFADARAFQHAVTPFLQAAEAEYNLLIGLIDQLARRWPDRCMYNDQPALMAGLMDDQDPSRVAGVALMTPPHKLILSRMPAAQLAQLFDTLGSAAILVPGINGPDEVVQDFASRWRARAGRSATLQRGMRIYQLDRVLLAQRSPGRLRLAQAADLPVIMPWAEDFDRTTASACRTHIEQLVRDQQVYLWQSTAGVPLAMAGWMGRTQNGGRIGNVYTPPGLREQGFGSSVVAGLSQILLDQGRRFCFLYTELHNPTSNHIYQVIGYRPICDCQEWHLS